MSQTFLNIYSDALAWGNSSDTDAAKRYINDALNLLSQADPAYNVTVTAITITASASSYTLGSGDFSSITSSSVTRIREIIYTSPGELATPLVHTSIERILALQPADAAGPTREYAVEGGFRLYFWPNLRVSDTLSVHWVPEPTNLSADTDVPGIPEAFHGILADYAAWQLCKADDLQTAEYHRTNWERGKIEFRKHLRQRRGTNTIVVRPGYPGDFRRGYPHDNSTYPVTRPTP